MIVRELFTRLGFKTDESGAKKFDAALVAVKRSALGVVGAVSAGVAAVTGFTIAMGISGNQLAKTARIADMSIKDLDGFTFAVERLTLLSKGDGQAALVQYAEALRQASFGGRDFATSFRRLGFTIEEIRNRTVSANDVMARLQVLAKDNTQEALALHVASQIFGSGLANQIIPALRESNDTFADSVAIAGTLGATFSKAGGEHSERLIDGLHNVQRIVMSLSIQIAEKLIPPFADFIHMGTDYYAANKDLIDSGIDKFFERLGVVVKGFATFAKGSFTAGQELVSMLGGLRRILNLIIVALMILTAIGVVKFFTSAAAAAKLFGAALWALARNPVLLPMLALVLVLEDLVTWLTGGNSLLGKMVGEFADLKPGIKDTTAELKKFYDQAKEVGGLGAMTVRVAFDLDLPSLDGAIDRFQNAFAKMINELGDYIIETIRAHFDLSEIDIKMPQFDLGIIDRVNSLFSNRASVPAGSPSRVRIDGTNVMETISRNETASTRRVTSQVNLNTDFNLAVSADDKSFTDKLNEFLDKAKAAAINAREAAIRQSLQDAQAVD